MLTNSSVFLADSFSCLGLRRRRCRPLKYQCLNVNSSAMGSCNYVEDNGQVIQLFAWQEAVVPESPLFPAKRGAYRDEEMDVVSGAVSYTHLTLPTSDLV